MLISDCGGDADALAAIFAARPDVLNHNLETVARLQRAARPSAGYARSLAVLARAAAAGLVVKSGIILGMGETEAEVRARARRPARRRRRPGDDRPVPAALDPAPAGGALVDARGVRRVAEHARSLGFAHVEAGPLVRSSYHAKQGAREAAPVPAGREAHPAPASIGG